MAPKRDMMKTLTNKLDHIGRTQKIALQVIADCSMALLSFVTAVFLRFESVEIFGDPQVWLPLLIVLPITLATFHALGLYMAVIRYITVASLVAIGTGVAMSGAALLIGSQLLGSPLPALVAVNYALLLFLSTAGVRFLVRSFVRRPFRRQRKPVIIYGAGEAGRQVFNALMHGRDYVPVAFVDDSYELQKVTVGGLHVHPPSSIELLMRKTSAREVLLAIPSAKRSRLREIVASLEHLAIEVKTIPGMSDIISGRATISDLRSISPEDLLGRDPVAPHPDLIRQTIAGKVVMVSGAGGSIGAELCRQIMAQKPAILILFEISEFALYSIEAELRQRLDSSDHTIRLVPILGSVQHPNRLQAVLRSFGVQTVYHAAAYKHVPLVEENVVEGIRNNVFGTLNIARAAQDERVENFILISTDKAVRPTNFMGASKRMAELVCQALANEAGCTVFSMVRFGNVLGSSGSVVPLFRDQIERGGPVTVTHREINRFFMTIPEAAQLVIQAGALAKGGDVFVLDMGEPVKIIDLALTMIRLHGLTPYIIEDIKDMDDTKGDIPVLIMGLRKGEKLYEELLIGGNPTGTQHPRILTASETSIAADDLVPLLGELMQACERLDVPAIREILFRAPLAFAPRSSEISDLTWTSEQSTRAHELTVISGTKGARTGTARGL